MCVYAFYIYIYIEDLPGVMDNRDKWQERVREIRAGNTKL